MERRRLAIVGFGRLGTACVEAARESADIIELAGVVRRPASAARLPVPFAAVPVVTHVRDLGGVDAVLLCVPPTDAAGAAREILQMRIPLIECASLDGPAAAAHYEAIGAAARNHHAKAVVGAGWDPGVFPLLQRAFEVLVPKGVTSITTRPGVSLHHTEAAKNISGIIDALTTECRNGEGRLTRYVYAELAKGVDPTQVQAALDADPLFAGERTLLFPVESISGLEEEGHGVLLERRGKPHAGAHQNILLEARFDVAVFAARVMLDAFGQLPMLKPGMHRYSLWADGPVQRRARH
jgi:diaminopimelate dehydrogenase